MAKSRTRFLCRSCGGLQPRWLGRCPDCGAWDALERVVESDQPAAPAVGHGLAEAWIAGTDEASGGERGGALPISAIEPTRCRRLSTGVGELDRVLGGGLVAGSIALLGGDPGIGKSTLLLQAALRMARGGARILYVSSEESAYQVRLRAERLLEDGESPPAELLLLGESELGRITEQARRVQPAVLVLDSIQLAFRGDLDASPGSVAQIRRCATELVYLAKVSGMAVAVVGHVTKDGQLAGPKLLEHMVDVVLSFEGDRHHAHRVVRAIKNRFGTTLEVGLFEMTGTGLAQVDPSLARAEPGETARPGCVVAPVMHGSRCIVVELQALVAAGFPGAAKRKVSGLDTNRLAMLVAVLEQHGDLRLVDRDIFASAVGGLRVVEPAADLALLLAVAGAHLRSPVPAGTAVCGEVGLGGEVRGVPQMEARLRECARLGFRRLIVPSSARGAPKVRGVEICPARTVGEALGMLENGGGVRPARVGAARRENAPS